MVEMVEEQEMVMEAKATVVLAVQEEVQEIEEQVVLQHLFNLDQALVRPQPQ
jgi:hypothetical protein